MNRIWIRIAAFFCAAALLLSITGCRPKEEKTASVSAGEAGAFNAQVFRYDVGTLFDITKTDSGYLLCSEHGAVSLQEDFSFGAELDEPADPFAVTAKGTVYAAWVDDFIIYSNKTELCRMDRDLADGLQLFCGNDSVWACDGRRLYRNDTQLRLPQTADGCWRTSTLFAVGEDLYVLLTKWSLGENAAPEAGRICKLSEDTNALTETDGLAIPVELLNVDPLCAPESGCVYGNGNLWKGDGEHFTLLADLQTSGVNLPKLRRILVLEDGRIVCLQENCLIVLSKEQAASEELSGTVSSETQPALETTISEATSSETQAPQPPKEKTTLRVGCLYSAFELSGMISYVNLHSAWCRLEVREYDNVDQLNRAILSGEVDVLGLGDLDLLENYAQKGLLVSLEALAPAVFSSGALYDNMVDALRVNGSCQYLPLYLEPSANVVPKRYNTSMSDLDTPEAFFAVLSEKEPEMFDRETKEIMFSNWLSATLRYWVDPDTGKTRFQSKDFTALLEYCDRFVLTQAEAMANQGAQEYDNQPRSSCQFPFAARMAEIEKYLFVAPPFGHLSACNLFCPAALAIVDNNVNTDAARTLLEALYTDEDWHAAWKKDGMWSTCISINREWTEGDLDAYADREINAEYSGIEDVPTFLAEIEEIKQFYRDANHFHGSSSELENVILEEVQVFFHGDCSAEEAARRIQNRIEIYLAERG